MRTLRAPTALLLAAAASCARSDSKPEPGPSTQVSATEPDSIVVARADRARILGDSTAPIWIVVVSDFQCPFCKVWHDQTFDALKREFVQTGKVRLAYLHFPLPQHQHAQRTAELSMCAGAQGKFWETHDAIFDAQREWTPMPPGSPYFNSLAARTGVDTIALRRCVDSRMMQTIVDGDLERGRAAAVASTPTFFIGDTERLEGAAPIEAFRAAIEKARRQGAAPAR
jgi:protein-disulfide isomerase